MMAAWCVARGSNRRDLSRGPHPKTSPGLPTRLTPLAPHASHRVSPLPASHPSRLTQLEENPSGGAAAVDIADDDDDDDGCMLEENPGGDDDDDDGCMLEENPGGDGDDDGCMLEENPEENPSAASDAKPSAEVESDDDGCMLEDN